MGAFIGAETVRIIFPDGEWVDIKEELTQADHDYIVNRMAQAQIGKEAKVDINLGKLPLLERAIVAWSFTEFLVSENISRLRNRYRVKILAEIDRLSAQADEWQKNSLMAST